MTSKLSAALAAASLAFGGTAAAHDTWFAPLPSPAGEAQFALGTGNRFPVTDLAVDPRYFTRGGCRGADGRPHGLQMLRYTDTTTIDFDTHEAPSLGPVCTMLHGIVASEVVNLLTGVRPVRAIPHYAQFDMRTLRFKAGRSRWGNDGPIQRVKIAYVTRRLGQGAQERAKTG